MKLLTQDKELVAWVIAKIEVAKKYNNKDIDDSIAKVIISNVQLKS